MGRKKEAHQDLLEIEYRPADLPSSQHRAGLAGLVLMTTWIKEEYISRGICDVEISGSTVMFYVDQLGLSELFNGLYAASREEQSRPRPMRNLRTGEIVPPLREEVQEVADPETGLRVRTRVCVYEVVVPQGAFLAELDPSGDEERGLWIKLWREAVWTILRGVPATRKPYEARANDQPVTDSLVVWDELCRGRDYKTRLSGTSYLGAQSLSAERVPFMDLARNRFLLNFWPLVAQVYVPVVLDPSDRLDLRGFVIAVPDVLDQALFSERFFGMMLARGTTPYRPRQFRPEGAVVGLVEEAGLDLLCRFRDQLDSSGGSMPVERVLGGVDLFHLERQGNTVQSLDVRRVDSDGRLMDQYLKLRRSLINPLFRRQHMANLINRTERWYAGFGEIMTGLPVSRTLLSRSFRADAATVLTWARSTAVPGWEADDREMVREISRIVDEYPGFDVDPISVSGHIDDCDKSTLRPDRMKTAREIFQAVRARKGDDFIDYFVFELLTKRGKMDQDSEPEILKQAEERPDDFRVLTLLALAALVAVDKAADRH